MEKHWAEPCIESTNLSYSCEGIDDLLLAQLRTATLRAGLLHRRCHRQHLNLGWGVVLEHIA